MKSPSTPYSSINFMATFSFFNFSTKKLFFLKSGSRRHNIFGLWSLDLKDALYKDITSGHRKVEEWADKIGPEIKEINDDKDYNFLNINTKEDLEKAKNKIK